MDARGRRRIFLAAVAILVVAGGAGWVLALSGACDGDACGNKDLPAVLASGAWLIAALVALALMVTGRASPGAPSEAHAPPSPNRLAPAALAAGPAATTPGARLEGLFAALDRLEAEELRMLAVRPLDPAAHEVAREAGLEAARASGRVDLVERSRSRIVDWVIRRFGSTSYDPTFVALAWRHEPLRVEDRAALADTLHDAALGCIVGDLVDGSVADELLGPCAALVDGMAEPEQEHA